MSNKKEVRTTGYKPKYSIILPTYQESENLPYMLWLINKHLNKAYPLPSDLIFMNS
jgi:cellulose synthase/poly-beta-1,6-N-acetylglucosamine synthase-like glycosyltransferase